MATIGPWLVQIAPWMKPYSEVGTWTRTLNTGQYTQGTYLSNGTLDNEFIHNIPLLAGTWTVTVIGTTASDYGISTVQFDGVSVGTLDWYSAGTTQNVVKQITGITVATSTIYAVKFKMATKHASASSYKFAPALVTLRRTA